MDPPQSPSWGPSQQHQSGPNPLSNFDPSQHPFNPPTEPADGFPFDLEMDGTSLDDFFQLAQGGSGQHRSSPDQPMQVDDPSHHAVGLLAPQIFNSDHGQGVFHRTVQPQGGGGNYSNSQNDEYTAGQRIETLDQYQDNSRRGDYVPQSEGQHHSAQGGWDGARYQQQPANIAQQVSEPAPGSVQSQLDAMLQERLKASRYPGASSQAQLGLGFPPSTGQAQSWYNPQPSGPFVPPLSWGSKAALYQGAASSFAQPLPSRPWDASSLASAMPFEHNPAAPARRDRSESVPSPSPSAPTSIQHPFRHRRAASATTFTVLQGIPESTQPELLRHSAQTSPRFRAPAPSLANQQFQPNFPVDQRLQVPPPVHQQPQPTPIVDASVSSGPGFYNISPGAVPTSTSLRTIFCMLALPDKNEATSGRPFDLSSIEDYSVSAINGVGFSRASILDFRGFLIAALTAKPSTWTPSLPLEDAIDYALVLVISLWMCNYIAAQMLASRTPITRGDVQVTFDNIIESVEVTVLLSIAAQVDLTKHTIEEVRKGWVNGSVFDAERKSWYKTRVVPLVKQKVDEFYDEAMSGTYGHILRGIFEPSSCPDIASQKGNDPMIVPMVADHCISGSNIHLISKNIDDNPDLENVDRLEMRHQQLSGQEALEVIAKFHADFKDGKNPVRCWRMWRNKLMTKAAAFLIFYFSKHAAVALQRFYDKRNPFVDPEQTMDYGSIIPVIAGMVSVAFHSVERFGSNVTGAQILNDPALQEVFVIKTKCVRAFIVATLTNEGSPPANVADITWFSNATGSRVDVAICAAEGTSPSLGNRSYYVTWDPSIPWTDPDSKSDDFLAYFEKIRQQPAGSPPPPWSDELRKVYEEAIRAHDLTVKQITEDSFRLEIIQMSHISPETAGESWPALQRLLGDALRTIRHDSTVVDSIISIQDRPVRSKRRTELEDESRPLRSRHASTAPPSRTPQPPAIMASRSTSETTQASSQAPNMRPTATATPPVPAAPHRGSHVPPRQRPLLPKPDPEVQGQS